MNEDWIETVLRRANELRAAGVLSIQIDNQSATFAPFAVSELPPDTSRKPGADLQDDNFDPLHDPASYPGGRVPGYEIHREDAVEGL